jgi:hypothetical protein
MLVLHVSLLLFPTVQKWSDPWATLKAQVQMVPDPSTYLLK